MGRIGRRNGEMEKTIFDLISNALAKKDQYVIMTGDLGRRELLWEKVREHAGGNIHSSTLTSSEVELKNGSIIQILVSRRKSPPRWLHSDCIAFDNITYI